MTAEAIATMAADLWAGRYGRVVPENCSDENAMDYCRSIGDRPVVVDYTKLADGLNEISFSTACAAPVYENLLIASADQRGVAAAHVISTELEGDEATPQVRERILTVERHFTERGIVIPEGDWRWLLNVEWYIKRHPEPGDPEWVTTLTAGPFARWSMAVKEGGCPMLVKEHYAVSKEGAFTNDRTALAAAIHCLDFLNCSNVDLEDAPAVSRQGRRKMRRAGVEVKTLRVRPPGSRKRSKSSGGSGDGGVPLTSVRGHYACYGPKYGRGLLFGKYEGRFWIPAFARGSAENGIIVKDYEVSP